MTVRDEAEGNVAGIWLSLGCGGLSGADVDVMQGTGKRDGELSQAQRADRQAASVAGHMWILAGHVSGEQTVRRAAGRGGSWGATRFGGRLRV